MNTEYKCLKISLSICCIFFAIDDVIVTSVDTNTSVIGVSIEGK